MGKPEEKVEIGPIALRVSKADVAAFCAATGFGRKAVDPRAGLPLAYIPTLLGHDLVKPTLIEALGALGHNAGVALLHLRQDVRAIRTLFPEQTYELRISCQRDGSERIVITGHLDEPDAGPAAQFESELLSASIGPAP